MRCCYSSISNSVLNVTCRYATWWRCFVLTCFPTVTYGNGLMIPLKLRPNCLALNWNWRFRQHMVSLSEYNISRRGQKTKEPKDLLLTHEKPIQNQVFQLYWTAVIVWILSCCCNANSVLLCHSNVIGNRIHCNGERSSCEFVVGCSQNGYFWSDGDRPSNRDG